MKTKRLVLSIALVLSLISLAAAADPIYVTFLGMHADRSTLSVMWGQYEENVAIKVSLGNAFGGVQIGIVFVEKTSLDATKIDEARIKLHQMLRGNDSWLSIEDFTKKIGLGFLKYVEATEVRR